MEIVFSVLVVCRNYKTKFILGVYYFDVTIVNQLGKLVSIITYGHPDPTYDMFIIRAGEKYQIKTTHSASATMFIAAFDEIVRIQINGRNTVEVTSSLKRESHVYYVPSSELLPTC